MNKQTQGSDAPAVAASGHSFGFGFHLSIILRKASMPAASIFAQCAGLSRMARSSSFSSGGVGGLPRGLFGSSMCSV